MRNHRFVRFAPIDLFVGLAERTHTSFHSLDEPESEASLVAPGTSAYGAFHTTLGHGAVTVGNFGFAHSSMPQSEVGASFHGIGPNGGVEQSGPSLYRWGITPSKLRFEQGGSLNPKRVGEAPDWLLGGPGSGEKPVKKSIIIRCKAGAKCV
jgi:hypothetical protein